MVGFIVLMGGAVLMKLGSADGEVLIEGALDGSLLGNALAVG
eukprot:CAMPEP_0194170082 /NCGR_PEP_ID=MMETSP0154-20130528/4744_1 /TAXON_ID=1049557 /ORGANISM="Thalassiothrix antarctica, Strain L6-D1" /LENGTH=41 /DNA_ID= /DNA_START= /DNA_END= /DNA_ORIENTATION=